MLAMLGIDRRLRPGKPEGCVVILSPRMGDWEIVLRRLETLHTCTARSASASQKTTLTCTQPKWVMDRVNSMQCEGPCFVSGRCRLVRMCGYESCTAACRMHRNRRRGMQAEVEQSLTLECTATARCYLLLHHSEHRWSRHHMTSASCLPPICAHWSSLYLVLSCMQMSAMEHVYMNA